MDNTKNVEGAKEADYFILRLTEAYTESWVSGDNGKRQTVLDALYSWAQADAQTQTKSCVQNGRILINCTQWTQSDGQDLSAMKDHEAVQMHIMHLAYGYYLSLLTSNQMIQTTL